MSLQHDLPFGKRLVEAITMFVVAALSLTLLIYVAYGEAKRTFEQFQVEKLIAQGQVVQSSMESFVRPGLPMEQFVGFNGLAEPMVKADPLIDSISAIGIGGAEVFSSGLENSKILSGSAVSVRVTEGGTEIRTTSDELQLLLPVRNRFEQVGHVVLTVQRGKIAAQVEQAFEPLTQAALAASFIFAMFVLLFSTRMPTASRSTWVGAGFATAFICVAILVVSTLISVYAQGAQARSKSLADSLGQRLGDLVEFNVNFDDVTGIFGLFGEYKRLNPELRAAALLVDGKVRAHVDPTRRDTEWDHVSTDYEYAVALTPADHPRQVVIKVALPREIVFHQVARSVKNFGALFVASALFAGLFMGLVRSIQHLAQTPEGAWSEREETATINLVTPVFFLAVFVEHLSYAFLPPMMQALAAQANLPQSYAAAPFTAYYLAFALSLIPAGRLEPWIGARNLILLGLALAGAGLTAMSMEPDFYTAVAARVGAGVGQGTLFIGVQAYVLANSAPERRTRAGSAIVFGFQAGMIAGMAIGSLLVSYAGQSAIFQLGGCIAFVTALYGLIALPSRITGSGVATTMNSAWRDMWSMLRDGRFARSIFLVGMPAKAVLTGIILFALPLLLTQQGFLKEDIGQITMIYAGAVILSSYLASSRADRNRNTERILFEGICLTALGLGLMATPHLINWSQQGPLGVTLIVLGASIVGWAHGFINAPIVTHVTETEVAGRVGTTNTAAAYRLLERVGHIMGPFIMGQVFYQFGLSWSMLAWVALAIFVMGALFLSPAGPQSSVHQTRAS